MADIKITAEAGDNTLVLTGKLAEKIWNYILEDLYIQEPAVNTTNSKIIKSNFHDDAVKEGYLGKV